jgi:hypothetical protein
MFSILAIHINVYFFSFDMRETLNITIYNLHMGIELTYPVYFSNGTIYYVSPNRQTDIDTITMASFGRDAKQKIFKGALLYKLQGKHTIRIDDQPDSDIEFIEDIAANIHFLVTWHVENDHYNFYVCLLECTDDFTWDKDKLWVLYREYEHQFRKDNTSNIITWLVNDVVIETSFDVTCELDYKLDIVISEGAGKYNMKRPIQINSERLVLP